MSGSSSTAFGVHVGNSSACIAVSKEGKTDVVANDAGDRVTPAMVSFSDSEITVGLAAKQGRLRNLANTVTNNKIYMSGEVREEDDSASPVTIKRSSEGAVKYEVDFKEREYYVSPGEILQHIYKYMHDIAASHCKDVDASNTVITVPITYSETQRRAVVECATAAGFRVVQVVNEPVAACLAHGLEQVQDRRYILVFRVGGLSMTASIILVSGGCYTVVDTIHHRLGGEAVTDVLVNYLGKEFRTKYKEDILSSKKGKAKLGIEAEKVKHVLSTLDTAHCYVESLFDGLDFSTNVTRARFDNEISKVVSDLLGPISELLSRCKLSATDIAHVVLSGGTTKIVKIQKQLSSLFTQAEIHTNIPPDESIAVGAAVQASYITREVKTAPTEKILAITRDIIATSDALEGGQLVLVPADSTVPVRRSLPLTLSSEGAQSICVKIVSAPDTCLASLTLALEEKSKPTLGFHIHRDGASHFTLTDKTTGNTVDAQLKPSATAQ